MMDCKHIDELLMDFLYQELDPAQVEHFEAHLHGCTRCARELSAYEGTRTVMRDLPELEPPPRVEELLLREAARAARPAATPSVWERLHESLRLLVLHPAMTAAVTLVVVLGVSFYVYHRGSPRRESAEPDTISFEVDRRVRGEPAPVMSRETASTRAPAAPAEDRRAAGAPRLATLEQTADRKRQQVTSGERDVVRGARATTVRLRRALDEESKVQNKTEENAPAARPRPDPRPAPATALPVARQAVAAEPQATPRVARPGPAKTPGGATVGGADRPARASNDREAALQAKLATRDEPRKMLGKGEAPIAGERATGAASDKPNGFGQGKAQGRGDVAPAPARSSDKVGGLLSVTSKGGGGRGGTTAAGRTAAGRTAVSSGKPQPVAPSPEKSAEKEKKHAAFDDQVLAQRTPLRPKAKAKTEAKTAARRASVVVGKEALAKQDGDAKHGDDLDGLVAGKSGGKYKQVFKKGKATRAAVQQNLRGQGDAKSATQAIIALGDKARAAGKCQEALGHYNRALDQEPKLAALVASRVRGCAAVLGRGGDAHLVQAQKDYRNISGMLGSELARNRKARAAAESQDQQRRSAPKRAKAVDQQQQAPNKAGYSN